MSYGPQSAVPAFDYHEYQMAYLGKLFYAAAGKNTAVSRGTAQAVPGKLTLTLKAAEALPADIAVTVRDKFSAIAQSFTVKKSLEAGENTLELALAAQTLAGLHIVDVLVSGQGGTLWWGAAAFDNPAQAKISAVKVPSRIFKKTEKIPVEVAVDGDAEIRYSLFDTYGNEFARGFGAQAELPLADCRTPIARLTVELV